MRRFWLLSFVLLGLPLVAAAQQVPGAAQVPTQPHDWTSVEIVLSIVVLVFALLVLALQAVLIVKARSNWHPTLITRTMGLTLIIAAGLFMITAGYSADQVSPVMGLLGTVAGYLLGSTEARATTP